MSMKLTAEQVRKAILIGGVWDEDTGTYYVNRTDMQAIADELNAALDGMDSCRLYLSGKESNYKKLFGTPEKVARMIIDSCGGLLRLSAADRLPVPRLLRRGR